MAARLTIDETMSDAILGLASVDKLEAFLARTPINEIALRWVRVTPEAQQVIEGAMSAKARGKLREEIGEMLATGVIPPVEPVASKRRIKITPPAAEADSPPPSEGRGGVKRKARPLPPPPTTEAVNVRRMIDEVAPEEVIPVEEAPVAPKSKGKGKGKGKGRAPKAPAAPAVPVAEPAAVVPESFKPVYGPGGSRTVAGRGFQMTSAIPPERRMLPAGIAAQTAASRAAAEAPVGLVPLADTLGIGDVPLAPPRAGGGGGAPAARMGGAAAEAEAAAAEAVAIATGAAPATPGAAAAGKMSGLGKAFGKIMKWGGPAMLIYTVWDILSGLASSEEESQLRSALSMMGLQGAVQQGADEVAMRGVETATAQSAFGAELGAALSQEQRVKEIEALLSPEDIEALRGLGV
jgi:hypothetical protein